MYACVRDCFYVNICHMWMDVCGVWKRVKDLLEVKLQEVAGTELVTSVGAAHAPSHGDISIASILIWSVDASTITDV